MNQDYNSSGKYLNKVHKSLEKDELLVLIPVTIDLKKLVEQGFKKIPNFKPGRLKLFISLVAEKTVQSTKILFFTTISGKKIPFPKEYVCLSHVKIHSKDLGVLIGNDYKKYFNLLYANNVFKTRSPYVEDDGIPYGYGFTSRHRFSRLRFEIITDSFVASKFTSFFKNSGTKTYEKIFWRHYDKSRFSLDFRQTEDELYHKYLSGVLLPKLRFNERRQFTEDELISISRFAIYQASLKQTLRFLNAQYSFFRKIAPKKRAGEITSYKPVGRFYNPIAGLNKIVRANLYYDNEKLVQLDVKNCLPYLLSNQLPKLHRLTKSRRERLLTCENFQRKYFPNVFLKTKLNNLTLSTNYSGSDILKNLKTKISFIPQDFSCVFFQNFQQESAPVYSVLHKNNLHFNQPSSLLWSTNTEKNIGLNLIRFASENCNGFYNSNNCFPHGGITFQRSIDNSTNHSPGINLPEISLGKPDNQVYQRHFDSNFVGLKFPVVKEGNKCHIENPLISNNIQSFSPSYNVTPFYYNSFESLQELINRELEEFKTNCVEGKIYEQMIPGIKALYTDEEWARYYELTFKETYVSEFKQDRTLAKRLFIAMIYAKNIAYKDIQNVFRKIYPVVYDILFLTKARGYKRLTNRLFAIEAELIIDRIARELIKESKIAVFTIHDCIMIQERNIKIAKNKMKNVFFKEFANKPKIEKE